MNTKPCNSDYELKCIKIKIYTAVEEDAQSPIQKEIKTVCIYTAGVECAKDNSVHSFNSICKGSENFYLFLVVSSGA